MICPHCQENIEIMSTSDLAHSLDVTPAWVSTLKAELLANGHAGLIGQSMVLLPSAIEYILNRPDGRGRPRIKKP